MCMPILFQSLETKTPHPLDLNEILVRNRSATYFVRIKGNSFEELGAYEGDILVVYRSRIADAHRLYVAVIEGEFTLVDSPAPPEGGAGLFELWGAVPSVIHRS